MRQFRIFTVMGVSLLLFNGCSGKTYLDWFEGFTLATTGTTPPTTTVDPEVTTTPTATPSDTVELLSATAITPTQVRLVYDEPVTLAISEIIANYSIVDSSGNALAIIAAQRDVSDSRILFLDTALQSAGTTYTVTVSAITGVDGSALDSTRRTANFTGASNLDAQAATVISVSPTALTKIDINFSEAVEAASADTNGNYAIFLNTSCGGGAGPAISTASRSGASLSLVQVTTAANVSNATYSIQVSGVKDLWGNTMTSQCVSFTGFSAAIPTVATAISNSSTSLVITFTEDMDVSNASLLNKANYSATNTCAGGGSLIFTATTITAASTKSVLVTGVTTSGTVNDGTCQITVTSPANPNEIKSAQGVVLGTPNTAFLTYTNTDSTSPKISSAIATSNTNIRVSFSEPIDNSSVALADFSLTGGPSLSSVSCGPGPTYSYCDITTSSQTDTNYSLTVSGINDVAGNTLVTSTNTVVGDGLPSVSNIIVAGNGTIYITFTEPIGPNSDIQPADFTICPTSQLPCPPGTPLTINTASLYPTGTDPSNVIVLGTNPTTAGTSYTFAINDNSTPTLITDNNGNALNTNINSPTFTGDSLPTVVSASSPSPTSLIINFSEPVSSANLTGSFTIEAVPSCGTVSVASVVQASPGVVIAVLNSDAADYTGCVVTVLAGAPGVKDLNGNLMGSPNSTSFNYTGTTNGSGAGDTTAPTVLAATSLSNTTVRIFFSEAVGGSGGAVTTNYSIVPALTISGASCITNSCDITTSSQSLSNYQLTVTGVADAAGNIISGSNTASFIGTAATNNAPTVFLANLINEYTVDIYFSESVDLVSAQTTSNYTLTTGSFSISSATRQADNSVVRLVYSPGSYGTSTTYTATVANVTDLIATALGTPNSATFNGAATTAGIAPDLAAADDTGISNSDNITSQTSNLTFTGSVAANVLVTLYDNGTAVGTVNSDSSGNYSIDATLTGGNPGLHAITVTVTDAGGGISTASPSVNISIDNVAPTPNPPSAAPVLATADDTGSSNSDGITNLTSGLTFTGAAGVAEAGSTINIYSDNPTANTLIGTATVAGDGSYTVDVPATGVLAAGTHNISITSTDTAGNVTSSSASFVLQIDTTGPAAPAAAPDLAAADDTGSLNNDDITYVTTNLTFSGTVGANDIVNIYNGGTFVATTTANGVGAYSLDISLAEGVHSIATRTSDTAGNESIDSTAVSVSIDATAPTTPGSAPSLATANDTGILNFDGVTMTNSGLLFSGVAEIGTLVTVYEGSNNIGTGTADGSGNYSISVPTSGTLADGAYTITVTATDIAGNASGNSPGFVLNIDNTVVAPGSAPVMLTASDSGILSNDELTNLTSVTFTGVAGSVEGLSGVAFYDGSTGLGFGQALADGSYSIAIDLSTLANVGSRTITAKQIDVAGNTSGNSAGLAVTIDTTGPTAMSSTVTSSNTYINIAFPEGVYGGNGTTGGPVQVSGCPGPSATCDLTILFVQNGGTATNTTISGITKTSGAALTGGETTIRVLLTVSGAPSGSEEITIAAVGSTFYDGAGNASTFTTGTKSLNATGTANITSGSLASSNAYMTVNFDEAAYSNTGATGSLVAADFQVLFVQNSGNATAASIGCVTNTASASCPGTAPAAGDTSVRVHLTITGSPSGTETVEVKPATGTSIYSATDGATPVADTTGAKTLNDTLAPVISSVAPATSATVLNSNVSYTLSEACTSGSVTFTRTSGTADAGSPWVQAMTGTELNSGAHSNITLTNSPTLVDGAIYSIAFNCTDAASNAATTVTSTSVTYDTSNPVISAVAPTTSAFVNSAQVSYTFSEACASGSVTYTRTSGTADGASPHVQALAGSELNSGVHTSITLTNNPTLVNGTVYTFAWDCTDAAGNIASQVTSTSVNYNAAPPTIVSAQTIDSNNNGKIDSYKLTFNNSLNDSTFPGYALNLAGSVTADWLIAGYANVKLLHGTAVTYATDTVNDNVIYLQFSEQPTACDATTQVGCDSGAKPDLTTTATPGLQDISTNALAQVNTVAVTEADTAKPILVNVAVTGSTSVDAIFSETVDLTTSQTTSNYSITGGSGLTVSSAVRNGTNTNTVALTTSAQTSSVTYTLTVNTNVLDAAGNNTNSSARTDTFVGINNPVVVSIVTVNATTLTITFNESVTAASTECANSTACALIFSNTALPVLTSVSTAGATNNAASYTLTVNPMIELQNYTTSVLLNTVTSVATGQKMASTNNSASFVGDGKPGATLSVDTATDCPTFNTANGVARRVVVQYDQVVTTGGGANAADLASNYAITGCLTGADCVSGSPQASATSVSNLSGNKFGIDFLTNFDTDSSQYQLTISNVQDANSNTIAAPGTLGFQCGTDTTAPSLISVSVVSAVSGSTIVDLTFSEALSSAPANTAGNFKYDNNAYGFGVSTSAIQTNTTKVQVTFVPGLTNGGHQMRVQNVTDLTTINTIVDNGINNVQPFIVNAPTGFSGGSVFTDPFNDGTPAGQLVVYDSKLYLGSDLNSSQLFEMDFALTTAQTILLDADGVFGAPTSSFNGYLANWSGCNPGPGCNTAINGIDTVYAACVGGTSTPTMTGSTCTGASGTETFFIGALNTAGYYKSFWTSNDKSSTTTTFLFGEQRNPDAGGSAAFRSTVFLLFKDQIFNFYGAELGGGGRGGRVCMKAGGCSNGDAYLSGAGFGSMNRLKRIGPSGSNTLKNGSINGLFGEGTYLSAINVAYEYDNDGGGSNESQMYLANGGYYSGTLDNNVRIGTSDGGIVRTKLTYSSRTSLPTDCTTNGCTTFYEDITPDANNKWSNYMSIAYPQNSAVTGSANCATSSVEMDCSLPYNIFVPSMKAIPYMKTAPNGDLYILRNACSVTTICRNGNATCDYRTERQTCPSGNEVPQLWMLPQGTTGAPKGATDWVFVAENGSTGKTNMAINTTDCATSPNKCLVNTHTALLEFVGNYLYVGFDNATYGSNIWRVDFNSATCTGSAACTTGLTPAENQFTMVNIPGIDGTAGNSRLFSHVTVNDAGTDWLIIVTRDGSSAMKIYRTANGQN